MNGTSSRALDPQLRANGQILLAGVVGYLVPTFILGFAAKYGMTSVSQFMVLETAFTVLQFVVVAPLIALAYRRGTESSARSSQEDAYAVRS